MHAEPAARRACHVLPPVVARETEGPFTGDGSVMFWATPGFVGPLATAFCFSAVNAASTWLPAAVMSTAMLDVPLTGVALSVLLLGEAPTPALLAGSLAIASGIAAGATLNRPTLRRGTTTKGIPS